MKSLTHRLSAAACIALGAGLVHADQTLSGPMSAKTYTFYDEDITIENVTVTGCLTFGGGAGRAAPAATGFRVVVYGGSITVSGAIHAGGSDGVDGVDGRYNPDGTVDRYPGAGTAGGPGCSVTLETYPLPNHKGPVEFPIVVTAYGSIDVSGGDGGDGGDGDSVGVEPCGSISQNGATGGKGGRAGSITLLASGDISITGSVNASGGSGGDGGSGASAWGPPGSGGLAREGRPGGAGGSISIAHTSHAEPDAVLSVVANANLAHGFLGADGGRGGNGGRGGSNDDTPQWGGNGGPGGAGGSIDIDCHDVGFGGDLYARAGASASGGDGGVGGGAGSAGGGCYDCVDHDGDLCDTCLGGGQGAGGGIGGHGGDGGDIDVAASVELSLLNSTLRADGGSGKSAGFTGSSTVGSAVICEDECPGTLYSGWVGTEAGDGGDGATITINTPVFDILTGGWVSVRGGDGGHAVGGGAPGSCCDDEDNYIAARGGQGGRGGDGGNAGQVTANVSAGSFMMADFDLCGGAGRDGGDGADGQPGGNPGLGGDGGNPGTLVLNGLGIISTCSGDDGDDGEFGAYADGSCGGS